MKKETIAKLSALSLATMLLTSCMGNKPAETTISTSNTEPSTSQTTEPITTNHIDFDYPDPVEIMKNNKNIHNLDVLEHVEPYEFIGFKIDQNVKEGIVYHKFRDLCCYDTYGKDISEFRTHYVYTLACGRDNTPNDEINNLYKSEFAPSQSTSIDRICPSNKVYLCDSCFNNEDDIRKFKEEVSKAGAKNLEWYYISPEIDFKMESELEIEK